MKLEGINIKVEKTDRRKTVSIFIERDGSVRVLAPSTTSDEKIEEAVKARQYQIFSKLAKWQELNEGRVNRKFVNGQSFLYFGRNYRLSIVEKQDVPLKLIKGYLILDKNKLDKADEVFRQFYKEKGKKKIEERLKLIAEKFEQKPTSIKVMELQNRWASWSPKHGLNFHWKCAMAPVPVIDYIITHEMVHLKYPNHSPEFWNELDKKMPDYKEYENWLKQNGVKMSI
ncbi:MAG: M48 family metallopeptidase [Candidatus Marinimicrobia bacterium]|nr:M48 family metallopeptidase [Candidatus Neomarinimicrobiota bacterium]